MNQQQSVPVQSDSSDIIAMIVEVVFGLFGILGMGWLYAGNFPIAIAVFIGFAIIIFLEAVAATATVGIAFCLIIPVNLAILVISGFRVRDYVRRVGASGSILYLILGFIVGSIVICGGIILLTGGLTALLGSLQ